MKNVLVAQSGGPTAAINATLAGVIQMAQISSDIEKIYGSLHGIEGILEDNLIDVTDTFQDMSELERLAHTPAAAIGSCRLKLKDFKEDEKQYEAVIQTFKKYNIGIFIYIGGNDSMDTVAKLSAYCKMKNLDDEIKIMGAPKTIDNDLAVTDHCPGFGSAAKYIATTFAELDRDLSVYQNGGALIVEVMGRDAGWLTASSALSRVNGGNGPDLIYLCEVPFSVEKFLDDVVKTLKRKQRVVIAVSEGIKNREGVYISELGEGKSKDAFGHTYVAGAGKVLEDIVKRRVGCKVRSIELNLMQRCAAHILSATDIQESQMIGRKAVMCALEGKSGEMVTIDRISSVPYKVKFSSAPIEEVANLEKKIPVEWIHPDHNDVTQELMTYLRPLVLGEEKQEYAQGIPTFLSLM